MERVAFPRPDGQQRPLRSLFAPKATRVLRVLLEDPGRPWTLKALASETKVSLGQAFKVKQRLLDQELAAQEANGLRASDPKISLEPGPARTPTGRTRLSNATGPQSLPRGRPLSAATATRLAFPTRWGCSRAQHESHR